MKYLSEFGDGEVARKLAREIRAITTRPWALMEVCGGQTHSIIRNGIDQLLPPEIELIHGPGCPVCVTPLGLIDQALAIAARPGVIFCSFGDMLRVPGSHQDLFRVKSEGADVRVVYSPLDAVKIARQSPDREVVFFGIGFETTAPANAMAVKMANRQGLPNFSMLVSHVLVPPAIDAMMNSPGNRVQGFLAAGHVCSVMGYWQYPPLAERHRVPIVITGFEPLDVLDGIRRAIVQLESGRAEVENAYERAVNYDGNRAAQQVLSEVDWGRLGLAADTGVRVGLHTGPLFRVSNPVTARTTFYGSHVNRAARLEPVVAPGHIFVTEEFASSLVADDQERFACEYIGSMPLAKKFGDARLYRLAWQDAN